MASEWPRRVLLTGDSAGGVWTFVLELAAGLLQRGIRVQLATFGPAVSEAQRSAASAVPGLAWQHHVSRLEWMKNPWDDVASGRLWLQQVAREFRPDLVHLNTLSYGDADFGAPAVQTIHSCVYSWFDCVRHGPPPNEWAQYRSHVRDSLAGADYLTAPSQAQLAAVAQHYAVDLAHSRSIYNSVRLDAFAPAPKRPIILSAGRLWDSAKNIHALASIAPLLSWPVYLAGNAHHPSGETSSFDNCHLLGELDRPELAQWYARAAIYVMPARYEPFGLSCLEAAHAGCALVLGDIPSLRDIWTDNALFVAPDDANALHAAIESLVADETLCRDMGERARRRASFFTPRRMLDSYLDAYRCARTRSEARSLCVS